MKTVSKIVVSTFLSLITFNELAMAHGTMTDPISRVYQCREEGPETPSSAACIAASQEGVGPQQFYDWSAVAQGGANSNHKAVVADGMLCSGGTEKYAGLNLARSDWKATQVKANEPYTFKFFESAPHQTKYFKYYITKDSYDLTTPLGWDDLELLCEEGAQNSDANHEFTCTMPDKEGKHILYAVWQRSDSMEAFYSCSDIDFSNTIDTTTSGVDIKAWESSKTYTAGMKVSYESAIYEAQWWSQNEVPGSKEYGAWKKVGDDTTTTPPSTKLNVAPTMQTLAPLDTQIFYQEKLSPILVEFEAEDSDGTIDVVMAMINTKHYDMQKFDGNIYRLEWTPEEFGSYNINLHATDNKLTSVMKKIKIDVIQK